MARLLISMPCIGLAHFAAAVGMYYMRGVSSNPIFASDFIVLLIPVLLAFAGYFLVVQQFLAAHIKHRPVQIVAAATIAFAALFVSTSCAALYAFNRWGT